MSLELYTAATPNGWKVSIMLEELKEAGVVLPDLDVTMVQLGDGEQFSDQFTSLNPNQKIPVLVADDQPIIESCAILHYLAERYPSPLLPEPDRWRVLPWLYWQAANLGPAFGNKLSYTRYIDLPDEQKAHPLERFGSEALRLVAVLDRLLQSGDYLCGDGFTVADIAVYPWVRAYKWAKVDITTKPRVVDWLERVRARPGVARGVAYGVPDDEKERFSAERRMQYAANGASIADNRNIKTEL